MGRGRGRGSDAATLRGTARAAQGRSVALASSEAFLPSCVSLGLSHSGTEHTHAHTPSTPHTKRQVESVNRL